MNERTHNCGELNIDCIGRTVCLAGWVKSLRDHGSLCFIDIRDRKGFTQLVIDYEKFESDLKKIRVESVISIKGKVVEREKSTINPNLSTGNIEVQVEELSILNSCEVLPFPLEGKKAENVSDELRLRYRYLDLRRPINRDRLILRHKIAKEVRNYLDREEFVEVETPILFKSTPEGAREFLVPSRLNTNHFYALTQSPQQYKQILMVAGLEKYYSITKCFRDEDLRADRQPEFTQIDLEASFVSRDGMYSMIEGMFKHLWKECLGKNLETPFEKISFKDAMNRFGSDKPDVRFGLEISDVSDVFAESSFKVFSSVLSKNGSIKAINAKGMADVSSGEFKKLELEAKSVGAAGLAFIKVKDGEWKSPITKFFSENEKEELGKKLHIEDGDLILFAADSWERSCTILGKVRLELAEILKAKGKLVVDKDDFRFLWVVDFPLLSYDESSERYVASHHPFTSPVPEDFDILTSDPKKVRGQHYDLVLNGVELGGGSIRIHDPEVQKKVFKEVLQLEEEVIDSRFGYLLQALSFGAPPHGGIAFGLDRLVAIMSGTTNIRDVIAFPKTQKGQDLMSNSPGPVEDAQLKDLNIKKVIKSKLLDGGHGK